MTEPHDEIDRWMHRQVQPMAPPPGTFELIRKRARRRKATRAAAAAAGAAAVIVAIATIPQLGILQLHLNNGPASGTTSGHTESASPGQPTPSATPTPAGPPAAPSNFDPTSVTFVGTQTGWVLGQAGTPGHCGPPDPDICTSLASTNDGGKTWFGVSAPVTGAPNGSTGVSQLRFLNTMDGWAFGPELWATHDGGHSWSKISTNGMRVIALETAGTRAFAVWANCSGASTVYNVNCTSYALYSTPAGSDQWTPVGNASVTNSYSSTLAQPVALVLSGSTGYLLIPGKLLISGPLTGGSWDGAYALPLLCHADPNTPASPPAESLAATTPTGLVLICATPVPGGQVKDVYTSANGGRTWQQTTVGAPTAGNMMSLAGTSSGTFVLATTLGFEVSPDGGSSWTAGNSSLPVDGFSYVGMTTGQQGVALPIDASTHAVWFTYDGGLNWQVSPIP